MIIGMPVYDDVDMLDVTGPYEMFRWAGFDVELVAQAPGMITFRNAFSFKVINGFNDASVFDVLWVPGGDPTALAHLMENRTYLDFLLRQSATARYVASVCEGALLLAAAGLLDGYMATTHWSFIPCFVERFPHVLIAPGHPRFHLDRNRLTGGGISSGLDEALELIRLLQGTAAAQSVQQMTQYYPCPPVNSRIPDATTCPVPVLTTPRHAGTGRIG
jgi:cyclohexyl-isocyanide hydratase